MIGLNLVYGVAGLVFAVFALLAVPDRRLANTALLGLIGPSVLAGDPG